VFAPDLRYLPLARKWHTPTTHNWPNLVNFFPKKKDSFFSLIDHPAHPIGLGRSNQGELMASLDSPSPRASLAKIIFPVDCAGDEAQRQFLRNAGGAKLG